MWLTVTPISKASSSSNLKFCSRPGLSWFSSCRFGVEEEEEAETEDDEEEEGNEETKGFMESTTEASSFGRTSVLE